MVNFSKKILAFVVIFSLAFSPYLRINQRTANAQLSGALSSGFDVSGLGAVAVNCLDIAGTVTDAAQEVGAALGFGGADDATGLAGAIAGGAAGAVSEVPVKDSQVRKEQAETTQEGKKANEKERCLDAIARYAVLKVIDRITLETVRWINSGFEGNPFYLENPEKFFGDIAKEEILKVNAWYTIDPENYPFGQIVMETILRTLQRQFSQNVRFSLNQVLAHGNYDQFRGNFSIGGWAGYRELANPNNNPYGNYLLVNEELGRRTQGTTYNKAINFQRQLQQGAGFINQQRCVLTATGDPIDQYHGEQHPLYIPPGGALSQDVIDHVISELGLPQTTPYEVINNNIYTNQLRMQSICEKWETQTPGRVIAGEITRTLGSPLRQLELADELNENLGLIFDALLNQLVERGLSSLSGTDTDPSSPTYNVLYDQLTGGSPGTQGQGQPIGEVFTGTPGGNGIPPGPGIVTIQQSYLIQAQNNIDRILNEIIMPIRLLDYCVPGPNPSWYQAAYNNLSYYLSTVQPSYDPDPNVRQIYYRDLIEDITGATISTTSDIQDHTQFLDYMGVVFNAYSDQMFSIYDPLQPPPAVRPQLVNLYAQIDNYEQEIQNYQNNMSNINILLPQLLQLEQDLLSLPDPNDTNDPQVQAIMSVFAQLANQGLVSQSDLNDAENRELFYDGQIPFIESTIDTCLAQLPGLVDNTRVAYPYDSAISNHPDYNSIPAPNNLFFNIGFNDTQNSIDISNFGNGINITSGSGNTSAFESILQTVY